jgi:hypothetical protein
MSALLLSQHVKFVCIVWHFCIFLLLLFAEALGVIVSKCHENQRQKISNKRWIRRAVTQTHWSGLCALQVIIPLLKMNGVVTQSMNIVIVLYSLNTECWRDWCSDTVYGHCYCVVLTKYWMLVWLAGLSTMWCRHHRHRCWCHHSSCGCWHRHHRLKTITTKYYIPAILLPYYFF